MGKTNIEWVRGDDGSPGYTINPIRARNIETGAVGHFCEKVSPGCKNCYASEWNERVRPQASGKLIGTGLAFLAENRAKVEIFLDGSKLQEVLHWKTPRRIFWCDMTDIFGDWVTDEMLDRCFAVMALTPQHTHILVTKRAQRAHAYFTGGYGLRVAAILMDVARGNVGAEALVIKMAVHQGALKQPFPNIWLLVSVENQPMAAQRIPWLLKTPAAVRGLSLEPLLERVDVQAVCAPLCPQCRGAREVVDSESGGYIVGCPCERLAGLHWLIPGGESGKGARPCATEWIESIVVQGRTAGLAVFAKQTGSFTVSEARTAPAEMMADPEKARRDFRAPNGEVWAWRAGLGKDKKGGELAALPEAMRVRQFPKVRS